MRALAWGTLAAMLLVGCGDDMVNTDGGIDASMEMDAGPSGECGNDRVEAGEVCDDGNRVGNDGCSADCTSDETCGNGTRELAEVCDDGNTANGDGCSAGCDSDETCGNGVADFGVGEVCDDGNTADGDGCSADCTSLESCGNGIVEAGEECDDGNAASGDGCDECSIETCTGASDCDDANPCNGEETCGTDGVCAAGTALDEGDTCGAGATRDLCIAGACVTSVCGDGFTDRGATPAELCDDGDTDPGDGCDASCQLESCTMDSQCDDLNQCTSGHACTGGTCVLGAALPNGTTCDADAMPGTRDICISGRCGPTRCGDRYVDVGEQCDDGNTRSGDGCQADCTLPTAPITAFRVTSLELVDPHFYTVLGTACNDITNTVNTLIGSSLDDYSLNAAGLFQPLDLGRPTNPIEIAFGAFCSPATPLDDCGPSPGATVIATTSTNMLPAASICMRADATHLNPSYTDPVNVASGPCFVTAPQTFMVGLGAVVITLSSAQMGGTFVGGASPTRAVNGVIRGFLSETEARTATFDATIPIVGGDTIYSHLAAGGDAGSACESISSFTTDDTDMLAGERGFWFYLNFEAEVVQWTP
ncbi:MAG: hypothetical protein H6719_14865 [Sandaracinaceae bacterium]|nr:hypothetical protein [Sandaracinaceae bacterium]